MLVIMIIWAFFLLKEIISSLNISQAQLVEDFQELRRTLEAMNMFSANLGFFSLHLIQILILEALAWLMLWHFGNGWPITIFISFLLTISQVSRYPKPRQWLWVKAQNIFFLSSSLFRLLSAAAGYFLASYSWVSDLTDYQTLLGPSSLACKWGG